MCISRVYISPKWFKKRSKFHLKLSGEINVSNESESESGEDIVCLSLHLLTQLYKTVCKQGFWHNLFANRCHTIKFLSIPSPLPINYPNSQLSACVDQKQGVSSFIHSFICQLGQTTEFSQNGQRACIHSKINGLTSEWALLLRVSKYKRLNVLSI